MLGGKSMDILDEEEVKKIETRIEELEDEINYEEEKLRICGSGSSDLKYIESLKNEHAYLMNKIYE